MVYCSRRKSVSFDPREEHAVCSTGRLFTDESLSHSDVHTNMEFEHPERSDVRHTFLGSVPGNSGDAPSVRVITEPRHLCPGRGQCQWQLLPQWPGCLLPRHCR